MLQVSNLKKSYGSRVLFEDVTFSIGKGEIVGLVGRNGCGKSTLIKIITHQEEADRGDISTPNGYKIGFLDQHISFSKPTLLEEAMSDLPEEMQYQTYKVEKILFGLGFGQQDMDRDPREFSGGYQLRINLTKCLLQEPNLLLLDEPTNYLDILSLRWMRQFLKSYRGEIIIITHDRDFMDSVVSHTMGIHRGGVKKVKGNTQSYYEQLALEEEIYEKTRQNKEKKIKSMQSFVDRFGAKASKATQAQSMIKKIEKMGVMNALDAEQILGFQFQYKETPAKRLATISDLSFGFDVTDEELLFSEVNFEIKPSDRIAIIGKNGKGKTTLLNVLSGQLSALTGSIEFHPSISLGYYQQTNKKDLDPNLSVCEEISRSNRNLDLTQVRSICGAVMFSGDDANKKIRVLSGGEQGRVLLGKVLAHQNNLLFLDEPTNHLDMESIEVLTEQIKLFPGGVVFVTHNEEMLNELANKLIIFQSGKASVFLGGYQDFLEKVGWEEEGNSSNNKKGGNSKKDLKRKKAHLVNDRSKKLKPLQNKLSKIESEIMSLEDSLETKNKSVLIAVEKGEKGIIIEDLYKEIGSIQIQLSQQYEVLQDTSDKIDQVEKEYDELLSEIEL